MNEWWTLALTAAENFHYGYYYCSETLIWIWTIFVNRGSEFTHSICLCWLLAGTDRIKERELKTAPSDTAETISDRCRKDIEKGWSMSVGWWIFHYFSRWQWRHIISSLYKQRMSSLHFLIGVTLTREPASLSEVPGPTDVDSRRLVGVESVSIPSGEFKKSATSKRSTWCRISLRYRYPHYFIFEIDTTKKWRNRHIRYLFDIVSNSFLLTCFSILCSYFTRNQYVAEVL